MKLVHAGISVSSVDHADSFFSELLGLTCSREYTVPVELMTDLFGVMTENRVRIYDIGDHKLEVFITRREKGEDRTVLRNEEGADGKVGTCPGSKGSADGKASGHSDASSIPVNHLCIGTEDRESLIGKALSLGFRVYEREREGKPNLVFIYDHDGNPFEILEE